MSRQRSQTLTITLAEESSSFKCTYSHQGHARIITFPHIEECCGILAICKGDPAKVRRLSSDDDIPNLKNISKSIPWNHHLWSSNNYTQYSTAMWYVRCAVPGLQFLSRICDLPTCEVLFPVMANRIVRLHGEKVKGLTGKYGDASPVYL